LTDALIVNPFSIDEMAEAIHRAIVLSREECRKRMQRLRVATAENNVYRWAGRILLTLLRIDSTEQPESESRVASPPWEVAQAGGSF
jgi:trehalose 6-phosphate synthase